MIPVRKPAQSEGVELAKEVSYALTSAIQILRDSIKDLVQPLAKQLEQVKGDLTALESDHGLQRKEIPALTVEAYWEIRPCFICSEQASIAIWNGANQVRKTVLKYGPCSHREIEVALAELERMRNATAAAGSPGRTRMPIAEHQTK